MPDKHKQKLDRTSTSVVATISTLAARTSLSLGTIVVTKNFQAALYQGALDARGMTDGETLAVYVSNADLTQAQVEQCIEATPLHSRDADQMEASRRNVQYLGQLNLSRGLSLNEGNRLPKYRENVGMQFWVYNPGNAAMTTGAVANGQIWVYGRWVD